MICKWCGANVDVTKGKCEACGKPLPPVSDCGGFYNVVPKAAKTHSEANPAESQANPANAQYPRKDRAVPAKNRRAPWILLALLALIAAIAVSALILGLVISNRMAKLEAAIVQNDETAAGTEPTPAQHGGAESRDKDPNTEAPDAENTGTTQAPETTEETQQAELSPPIQPPQLDPKQDLFFQIEDDEPIDGNPYGVTIASDSEGTKCYRYGKCLWEISLKPVQNSESDGISFAFSYDAKNLGTYFYPQYSWKYCLPDNETNMWSFPETDDTLHLDQSWLKDNAPNGEINIQCTVRLTRFSGGTLTIEYMRTNVAVPTANTGDSD